MICAAPLMRAPWIAAVPMPPAPMTTTVSPPRTFARFDGRAVAGRDRARQQCARHQWQVRLDLHNRVLRHHSVFRERADLGQVAQRLAVGGVVAERLSVGMPGVIVAAPSSQRYSMPLSAPSAVAADRDERHHDVVARREFGYAVADLNDRSRAFVTADHGKHRGQAVLSSDLVGHRHVALEDVVIRVAQARGGHLDENLAGAWRIELEIFDRPRPAHVVQDRGAAPHDDRPERHGQSASGSGTACRRSWCPRRAPARGRSRDRRGCSASPRVSTLARCMPRQLWMPPAKEMCARRGRWMSNVPASAHRVSSRLAEPMHRLTCAPSGIVMPCISTSRVVLRGT